MNDIALHTDKISAIVVSYFTGSVLRNAIAALCADEAIAEIILVDNGNDPGAIEDAIAGTPAKVLTGHGNIGFAAACNLGAKAASGEYFLLINPDAILPPDGAADMLRAASKLTPPWLMGARLIGEDGREQQGSRRSELTPWRAVVEAAKLYKLSNFLPRFNRHEEPLPENPVETPTLSGACLLLHAEDYRRLGGMDEGYFLHVEDIDFCKRFRSAGGSVWFNPHVSVTHIKGSSRAQAREVEAHKIRGLIRYFNTHCRDTHPAPMRWMLARLLWIFTGLKALIRR